MRYDRTQREALSDAVVTLCLLDRSAPEGPAGDRLKVAKLVFLATWEMFRRRWKGLNFSFYRYTYGPFTPQLYETWEELSWAGLLDLGPGPAGRIRLTEQGREICHKLWREVFGLPANRPFAELLESLVTTYGPQGTRQILQDVYHLEVRPLPHGEPQPVRDVPAGAYITACLEPQEAKLVLEVSDEVLSELDAHRSWYRYRRLLPGMADLPAERLAKIREAVEAMRKEGGKRYAAEEVRRLAGLE